MQKTKAFNPVSVSRESKVKNQKGWLVRHHKSIMHGYGYRHGHEYDSTKIGIRTWEGTHHVCIYL